MTSIRPLIFALLMLGMTVIVALTRREGGPNGGGEGWLVPIGMLAAAYAVAVVSDVLVHAWKGEGQACRVCGHVRPLKSFHPAGPCPRCGD